jgi:hypothetical protein
MNFEAMKGITPYPVVQLGWPVFEDMETSVEKWVKATGAGPFFSLPHAPLLNVVHRGKPSQFDHTSTIGQWGDIQLELMLQHCDTPSHITDMSPDRRSRLASVSWFVPDMEAETARLEALGFPLIWSCNVFDETLSAKWFDATSLLGCCIEVFNENPMMRRAFAQCRQAAAGWNGDRPLRPMQEMMEIEL